MAKIQILRTDKAMPPAAALEGASALLFGAIDGMGEDSRKAWRKFWRRIMSLEPGEIAQIEATIPRNPKFHRKFFALLQVGFDAWDGGRVRKTYKGRPVAKNFERFRKDVLILAGFYDQTFDLRGCMVLEAKSISFANMDDDAFEKVYSSVADVLLEKVLTNYAGRSELDAVVNEILGFL